MAALVERLEVMSQLLLVKDDIIAHLMAERDELMKGPVPYSQ